MSNFDILTTVLFVVLTSYVFWDGYKRKNKNKH